MHESGRPVQRAEMLQVLQSLEAVLIQTVYDHKMASVGLSDVAMDTTVTYATSHGRAHSVEECRCLTQLDRGPQRPWQRSGRNHQASVISLWSQSWPMRSGRRDESDRWIFPSHFPVLL